MVDHTATARIERLVRWLEQFKRCFGHRAQLLSLRTYVQGVFSDSERKSMQAMLARVTEPVAYQAFQHFITHAPWDAEVVWRRLRAVIPERRGVLILDGTSFPKQGPHSVGVARQYCGALGKIANCQVATTVALWTGVRAWVLGATLYLPEPWLTDERRQHARIPAAVEFQEKWRHALRLLRQVRAAGFTLTAVLGDAEFGDVTRLRTVLHRLALPYALGISSTLTVFVRRPQLITREPRSGVGRPRTARRVRAADRPIAVRDVARDVPRSAWRWVAWRNGGQPARRARFVALRVTPATGWRVGRLEPEVWLLCEQEAGGARIKHYLVHLPPGTSLRRLVALAHQRWAIEQQYQELKSELGLDHFEGRTYPGWQHHVVLTAVAHAYIQRERMRRGAAGLTFPAVRAIVQEIFTALLFAAKPRYMHWMEQAKHRLQLRI
ncbi:MAG TPA: IS701 family transposase [Longimicrobiales bacterium]|nr:IS701 family transposase [Longimicrobiales bacterium]